MSTDTSVWGDPSAVGVFESALNGTGTMSESATAGLLQRMRTSGFARSLVIYDIANETGVLSESAVVRAPSDPVEMLQRLRTNTGLPVTDLARLLGVSRQSVHHWLRGEPVTEEHRKRIAVLHRAATEMTAGRAPEDAEEFLLGSDADGLPRLKYLAERLRTSVPQGWRGFNAYDLMAEVDDSPQLVSGGRRKKPVVARRSSRSSSTG